MSPKATLPLGSAQAKKSIGKALSFYTRGHRQFVKRFSVPSGPPSPKQMEQRLKIKLKVAVWHTLTFEQKNYWEAQALARGDPWSGYSLFMSLYKLFLEDYMSFANFRMPGRYHFPGIITGPLATIALTANRLWAVPFFVGPAQSFDRIAYRVTTAVADAVTRLGIYPDNGNIYPNKLALASIELAGTPTGFYEAVIDWTSEPYVLYWLVLVSNKAITVTAMLATAALCSLFGRLSTTTTTQDVCLYVAFAYAALPATFPGTPTYATGNVPAVFLRKKAV